MKTVRPGFWLHLLSMSKARISYWETCAPGSMALASFTVAVDANASLQDYQLGCLIQSGERRMELALPLALTGSDSFPGRLACC